MTTIFISHSSKDMAWATRVHHLLTGQGYENLYLDEHHEDGAKGGQKWETELYRKVRQSRAVVPLISANWLASPWCVSEVIVARERGKHVIPIIAANLDGREIPAFLHDTQFLDMRKLGQDETDRRLLICLRDLGLRTEDFPLPKRPYPGLAPFQERDAAVYFGRDDDIKMVQDCLTRHRRGNAHGFLLILGASGCGKSSLVRAGVLPRLRQETAGGSGKPAWIIVPPIMSGEGLTRLALAMADAFREDGAAALPPKRDMDAVRRALETPDGLNALATDLLDARKAPEGSVLIVLDQMEEVFGSEDPSTREMLRLLMEATAQPGSPVTVLATMRSDFLNDFQLFEGTAERYEKITLDPCGGSVLPR